MNRDYWCRLCQHTVEPLWMAVPNTGRITPYHLNGLSRHAITSPAGYTVPGAPGRELVSLDEHGTLRTHTST